jgi:hypothetical protein
MATHRRWIAAATLAMAGLFTAHMLLAKKLFEDLPQPPLPSLATPAGLDSISAQRCASCHTEIAAEWRATDHSEAQTNPLYQAELRHQSRPYVCAYCHTPLVSQRAEVVHGISMFWPTLIAETTPNPSYDEALEHEGVTCATCHLRQGAMVGPHPAERSAPHAVRMDPNFASVELCRPCHHLDITFGTDLFRPIQDTFAEWEEYRAKGGDKTCIDCHMPSVAPRSLVPGGPLRPGRSHALRGPSDIAFLKSGVVVASSSLERHQDKLQASVTIKNGSGHRIPTAEPERRLEIALEVLGPEGQVLQVQRNIIQRVVEMPSMSEKAGGDTTLRPRETRRVDLEMGIPGGAFGSRLVLRYILWEPTHRAALEAGLKEQDLSKLIFERRLPLKK